MNEKFEPKKIYEIFFDILKYSNYKILKCYNLVFTKYTITKNIGSKIVLIYFFINIGCLITFIIKGINPLKDKLKLEFRFKNHKLKSKDINYNNSKNKGKESLFNSKKIKKRKKNEKIKTLNNKKAK